jgi:nucleotide-binding universal stress UspA family protein
MFRPRVILHPTDFSEFSAYAFRIAVDLARQNDAALLVLHVAETLGPENVTYGEVATHLEPENYHKRLFDDLRQAVPAPEGVPVHYVLAGGDPAQEIERVAREHACDLIVMGTHGRTGLTRLFMGSIAEEVVRLAPCPVLVAKWHQPDSAA